MDALKGNNDFYVFMSWLALDFQAMTWKRKYEKEFFHFWSLFIGDNPDDHEHILNSFDKVMRRIKSGPLKSWFQWLYQKYIIYLFIEKKYSLSRLSLSSNQRHQTLSYWIRNFLVEKFPLEEDGIGSAFQATYLLGDGTDITYKELASKAGLGAISSGLAPDEFLNSFEVTLYSEWPGLPQAFEHKKHGANTDSSTLAARQGYKKALTSIFLYSVIFVSILLIIREGNRFYDRTLRDKIKIYDPQFLWNETGVFSSEVEDEVNNSKEGLNIEEIETFLKIDEEGAQELKISEFSPESDVIVTGLESIPRNIENADNEQSAYEETRNVSYRDTRFGRSVAYRVMMKTIDLNGTKTSLDKFIAKYNAEAIDNVRPGTKVPGGLYYNILLPSKFLKEFLFEVQEKHEMKLYKTTIRGRSPKGKSKVFIWAKNI